MTLKGTLSEFPLDALLRLLADTKKTGELSLRAPSGEGALGIAEGKVVTSVYGEDQPIPALGAIFGMTEAEFEFTPWPDAPPANLEGELQDNLRKAGEYREWIASVRQVVPNDRVRFRLSERAAEQGAVTFTSDRWRVVLAVNGQRDVNDLATHLKTDRDATLTTLAGLVRDGVIETIEGPAEPAPAPPPAVEAAPPPVVEAAPPPAPYVAPPPVAEAAPALEPGKPSEDWTAALLRREAEAARAPEPPPPPMPAAQDWGTPPPVAQQAAAPEPAPPAAPEPPASDQWSTTPPPAPAAQDWGAPPAAEPPAADWGTPAPAANEASAPAPAANEWSAPAPAEPAPPPPPVDDRLAALFGTPATPAAPAAPPAQQWSTPATDQWTTPAPAADQWTTPATDAPPALADDPRLGALTLPAPAQQSEPAAPAPNEWAPPPDIAAPAPKKKGLFGFGGGKEKAEPAERPIRIAIGTASRAGLLAAFSNALLTEYTNGTYGKGKLDDRMPSLLMRVDEQADPIDKPLPVVDDRLDVQALERIALPEQQAVPYLAILVSTIHADAEKTFGRDKAKKGYKVAQQNVFGNDTSALGGGDLAGKLPKV